MFLVFSHRLIRDKSWQIENFSQTYLELELPNTPTHVLIYATLTQGEIWQIRISACQGRDSVSTQAVLFYLGAVTLAKFSWIDNSQLHLLLWLIIYASFKACYVICIFDTSCELAERKFLQKFYTRNFTPPCLSRKA